MRFKARILVLIVLAIFAASCYRRANLDPPPASETWEVTDEIGRRLRVPTRITRVVSLAPNITEIVYAIGAGGELVGNTNYCDYPQPAKRVAKVGDTLHPSVERIIALKPQIVFVSTASQLETFTKQLDAQGIAVYVTNPNSLNAVFKTMEDFGWLFDQPDQAGIIIKNLQTRVQSIEERIKGRPPVRVFYQVSGEPLYTIGREAYLTDLIRRAGGVSVTADVPTAFPRFSDEAALASQPDAIILPTGGSMGSANSTVAPALKNSPAARNNRVHKINDDLLSRPGPRLVDGLEQLAKALHPEAFK